MPDSSMTYRDRDILQARPAKNDVDPWKPYAFLIEPELSAASTVDDVVTIFLTNRECSFRCLMCDLWKNTTDERVPDGAIPAQIEYALSRLPAAQHVKLYNSGNFFDSQAIPQVDWPTIAERCRSFKTVIVENHPRLCTDDCLHFRDLLGPETKLEIAMGLETVHPEVLPRLNKQMTLDDFQRATRLLISHDISVRAFILLRPPFLTEEEGIEWALRSLGFAFSVGVGCCCVIPTRAGNGIMDQLQTDTVFAPPCLSSLERVLDTAIQQYHGTKRVFVDLWDAERFSNCNVCVEQRIKRLRQMNLSQQVLPSIDCACGATA